MAELPKTTNPFALDQIARAEAARMHATNQAICSALREWRNVIADQVDITDERYMHVTAFLMSHDELK